MNKKINILLLAGLALCVTAFSQDLNFVKSHIKTLTSPEFHGRGYVKGGDKIAAGYLAKEFKKFGLQPFANSYFQSYNFPVNTFPGDMEVTIDGKTLAPGFDYMINPASAGCKGTFDIVRIDSSLFLSDFSAQSILKRDFKNKFVLLDTLGWGRTEFRRNIRNLFLRNLDNAAGVMLVVNGPLQFYPRMQQQDFTSLFIKRSALPVSTSKLVIRVKSKLINHTARNVIGFIPGQVDTFVVFTAHYDHLGRMGRDTYYPGANDNASGTAMLLDLIRQFTSAPKPKYSLAFMMFSGEEAGLLGSHHYVRNPLFPLQKIKLLINFDMMAAGSDGVIVYNGATYKQEFAKLDSINRADSLTLDMKPKGLSKGSDHYPFHEKQVKVIYINTGGKELGYHVPTDTLEVLPFTVYERLYKLVYKFVNEMK